LKVHDARPQDRGRRISMYIRIIKIEAGGLAILFMLTPMT